MYRDFFVSSGRVPLTEHLLPVHGGQTSNVSSDRLLNEHSLSGIFGIFLKRSHTCHWNGGEGDIFGGGNWTFVGIFRISLEQGSVSLQERTYRECIVKYRGVSGYWLSSKCFIDVSIGKVFLLLSFRNEI